MECRIVLSFTSEDSFWVARLPRKADRTAWDAQLQRWWQRFAEVDGPRWQRLLQECVFEASTLQPRVVDAEYGVSSICVTLDTGSEGIALAPGLVSLLHTVGCHNVEAVLVTDEAEPIIDEEGETHFTGERYYVDKDGRIMVSEYPEVEYLDE
ncbi:hypothetical protein G7045_08735 [Acidovorax sp. HDW3]|uniref:hypothetical protein n=1 Tax=Acidovorax sp. HDW3 TaxID=2714923 RepID=UPI00140AB843|nr:hypothetical protein [Acidovorax sp. HDW3]QIL44337.1 hypothetical protein G7045_08735 [Acidovorax sp. HDW3]